NDSPISETDQLLREIYTVLRKAHIPGLLISIVKKDSILFSGGLGYADLEQKIKVDHTTQFHLASITKFFVAMGIQKLIALGQLDLNDRLQAIAPEIPFSNKWESTHPVRLVHLLEHTAAFEDTIEQDGKYHRKTAKRDRRRKSGSELAEFPLETR